MEPNATSYELYETSVNGKQMRFLKRSEKYGNYLFEMVLQSNIQTHEHILILMKFKIEDSKNTWNPGKKLVQIGQYMVKVKEESLAALHQVPRVSQLYEEFEHKMQNTPTSSKLTKKSTSSTKKHVKHTKKSSTSTKKHVKHTTKSSKKHGKKITRKH